MIPTHKKENINIIITGKSSQHHNSFYLLRPSPPLPSPTRSPISSPSFVHLIIPFFFHILPNLSSSQFSFSFSFAVSISSSFSLFLWFSYDLPHHFLSYFPSFTLSISKEPLGFVIFYFYIIFFVILPRYHHHHYYCCHYHYLSFSLILSSSFFLILQCGTPLPFSSPRPPTSRSTRVDPDSYANLGSINQISLDGGICKGV